MSAAARPHWWDDACRGLARRDPVMRGLVRAAGQATLVSRGDPFTTLARSIVGQQISVKAAQTVWTRFEAAAREVAPARVARMRVTTLTAAGLSGRKAEYVRDLARHFATGTIDPARWPAMDDEAVIAELTDVRGIGRWTAEMFLMFNLLRPDVYPLDDIGLLRGVERHYGAAAQGTGPGQAPGPAAVVNRARRALATELGERWRPWRTCATWLLWRSLDPVPVEY